MYVPHLWHPARIFLLWGPDRFMVVLKSAQVARIRHAVRQTQSLWQGREKNKPAMHFLASLGNIQRQSASRQRSKRRLPKEKFLWPLGFWNFFPAWPMCAPHFLLGKFVGLAFSIVRPRALFFHVRRAPVKKSQMWARRNHKGGFSWKATRFEKSIHRQEIK